MPARPALALALAALLVAVSAAAEPPIDDPALRTQVTRLDNGLLLLTLEDRTTPVVSFQMWVKVGSKDEARFTGLAHLFEHMMFKGSARIGPEEHARLVQSRGGVVNAYTTNDHTVYYENVPAEALPLVIDLEAERVANLDISQETLESERQVVLEERRLRVDDRPGGRAIEALFSLAFRAHPYRWPVIGWRSDVAAATLASCRDFFRTYYAPDNIAIAIVGDFDSGDAIARVTRAFGSLEPAGEIPRNPQVEPEPTGERRETLHFDLQSPVWNAAWLAPAVGHPDANALDVAGQILSGGRSSRLYESVVRGAEQALSAYAYFLELQTAGLFVASASVRADASVDRVEELVFAEIDRLRESLASEAELEKARRQIEVALVGSPATNAHLASRIAFDTLSFGRIRPLSEVLDAIRAVTAADVQRVARTWLGPDRRSVVRVVPPPPEDRG